MDAIVSSVTTVIDLVGNVFDMISGNPFLATMCAVSLVGSAIGIFSNIKSAAGG